MLKVAAAVLAVPILAVVYVSSVLRRSMLLRTGLAIGLGGILAVGRRLRGPAHAGGRDPTQRGSCRSPRAAFGPVVGTGIGLAEPLTITFSAPMDAGVRARAHLGHADRTGRADLGRHLDRADDRARERLGASRRTTRSRSRPARSPGAGSRSSRRSAPAS